MEAFLEKMNQFFEVNLDLRSRVFLLLAVVVLVPAMFLPLWHINMDAQQFPEGLSLGIYASKLEGGGQGGNDLREINILNHYIGMQELKEEDFSEFKWIPFVVGAVLLLTLRAVVIGKVSKLVDVFVGFSYFGVFSIWMFYNKLYYYGHNLDPSAAVKVDPFMPPLFGSKQLANFTVSSFPGLGTVAMTLFPLFLLVALYFSYREWQKAQI
ncbi:hypothetical protein GWO43_15155 [candidate division KSB1 bacterium]|nr:hypothetical protein [candidate division KSB1 bacterium]NIR73475.1 hypothetical protein [candidate division KSB1 bacterium]NIS25279.1 hypothetical protein [candidate division KSB1 bacterium]NIT72183.1 hypothetical protein [candidate division KSB1 bacterium]NIU26001.1 hypothetical protein [candidate division KSB1 bacterium]